MFDFIQNAIDDAMFKIGLKLQDIEYPEGAETTLKANDANVLNSVDIGFFDVAKFLLVGYFALAVYSEVKSPTKKSNTTNRKYSNKKFGVRYKGTGLNYG